MNEKEQVVKVVINMLVNRVERLEKKIDALEDEQQATSKKELRKAKEFFDNELKEMNKLI